ncbi:MAG: lactate racemase domain-containing protein, partial [Thermodesulfobacteriota bacterium]|nr:lactate racemase domain-containing protein [Thermodesulfobacteriota bacterium]
MKKAFIIQRGKKSDFDIPPEWDLLTFADSNVQPADEDLRDLIRKAIENPIRSPFLRDCVSHFDKVAIIVEDITRASPKRLILEVLLEELDVCHIPSEHISVIISLGTHRGLTPEEMESTFGK